MVSKTAVSYRVSSDRDAAYGSCSRFRLHNRVERPSVASSLRAQVVNLGKFRIDRADTAIATSMASARSRSGGWLRAHLSRQCC